MAKIIPSLRFRSAQALLVGATVTFAALVAAPASASVVHTTGIVNGVDCDIWTWSDSANQQRTVALKIEGGLNAGNGHGGYAVQMTYYYTTPLRWYLSNIFRKSPWTKVTVNAANETDGGFGYFVSHERFRFFQDSTWGTIAQKIFNTDDSPLGLGFSATTSILPNGSSHPFAESFRIAYGHYGTIEPSLTAMILTQDRIIRRCSQAMRRRLTISIQFRLRPPGSSNRARIFPGSTCP